MSQLILHAVSLLAALPLTPCSQEPVNDVPEAWIGLLRYDGELYDWTLESVTLSDGPVLRLVSPLLGRATLFDVVSTQQSLDFKFEREDTGLVVTHLTGRDGFFVGQSTVADGAQVLLELCAVPEIRVPRAQLEAHVGLYEFESGPPLAIHTQDTADGDLFVSIYETTQLLPLIPLGPDHFIADLQLDAAEPYGIELRFEGERLSWKRSGRVREALRSAPELSVPAERIREEALRIMRERDIPSLSIGLVHRDALVFAESFGFADLEAETPATPETLYQLGSVMKPFTSTVVQALSERGELSWGDAVEQHLPEGVRLDSIPQRLRPAITLHRLSTHTSGLERDSQLLRAVTAGPTLEHLHSAIRNVRLELDTGARQSYSNIGVKLLAHAAETRAGKSIEDLCREFVFEPLGMADTTTVLDPATEARLATHYWAEESPRTAAAPMRFGVASGAGALISNVRDMAKFLSWQLGFGPDDERLLSPEARNRMHEVLVSAGYDRKGTGLAWSVVARESAGVVVGHGGESNGHSADLAFSPAHGAGAIVLANIGSATIFDFTDWLNLFWIRAARDQRVPTILEAERAYSDNHHGDTVWAYGYLTAANPDSGRSWYRLGAGHFGLRQYDAAAACYARALELNELPDWCHYQLARIASARGDTGAAVEQLTAAADAGFDDLYRLARHPEFDNLRQLPDYQALLAHLSTN